MQKLIVLVFFASCVPFPASTSAIVSFISAIKNAAAANTAGNTVEVAKMLGLTEFVKLAEETYFADTLATAGPFTLFGSSNSGFACLIPTSKFLLKNQSVAWASLASGVYSGKLASKDLKNDQIVPTLLPGFNIRINVYKKSSGTIITAGCREISKPDQAASNGLIHVLDGLLFFPAGSVMDVISTYDNEYMFTTFYKFVNKAGLVGTLTAKGPLTVFVPTNAAFTRLPPQYLQRLEKDPVLLKKFLLNHVVEETVCAVGLEDGAQLKTVKGGTLKVSVFMGALKVEPQAIVIYADIVLTNGVGHVINNVLIPK